MKTRVISGVVIGVLTVGLGLFGQISLGVVLLACALIGYYEMTRALGVHKEDEKLCTLESTGFAWTTALYVILMVLSKMEDAGTFIAHGTTATLLCILGMVFTNMAIYVFTFPKYHSDQVIDSIFAYVYVPVMISFCYRSKFLPYGVYVYALIFFCSWICDTFAYFAGRAFGKHKMAPILSPKKTVEGAIGGVCGSVLLCFLTAVLLGVLIPGEHLYWEFALIGLVGGLISIVGDLAASAIKRNHNIKDYGKVIPGHGGIMDRFDSVISTAPVIYYLGVLLLSVLRQG